MPLYKKTGFNWVPETDVFMRNYLPSALTVPAGKAFFANRDWYECMEREIKVAPVRAQVGLSLFTDFENFTTFKPRPEQQKNVNAMLDDLIAWGRALQTLRPPVSDGGGAI